MVSAAAAQLNDETFAALRAQPGFRRACESASAESVQLFVELEPACQWITKDLGRAAIVLTAAILHCANDLTVQNLTAACLAFQVSSPGRVNQVVRRCREIGQFTVEEGPGVWTRRRARLGGRILELLRQRSLCEMKAAITLAPELGGALEIMETDAGALSALMLLAQVSGERRDLFSFAAKRPLNFFLDREAGMLILVDLLASQAPDRARLLLEAPLSRYALARRYGVSRAHINKLLAESGHTEAIGGRVVFSEALSEALEAHYALVFALNQSVARTLLSGWRFRPAEAPPDASSAASAA